MPTRRRTISWCERMRKEHGYTRRRKNKDVVVRQSKGMRLQANSQRVALTRRIQNLATLAAQDGDNFNTRSEQDVYMFLSLLPNHSNYKTVLNRDGNLRVRWERDGVASISVEFLGNDDKEVRSVIVDYRSGGHERESGIHTVTDFLQIIHLKNLGIVMGC